MLSAKISLYAVGFLSQRFYNVARLQAGKSSHHHQTWQSGPICWAANPKQRLAASASYQMRVSPLTCKLGTSCQKCHVSAMSPSLAPPTRALPSQKTQQPTRHCTFDLLASFHVAVIQWTPPVPKMRQTAPSVIPQAVILLLSISHISRQ